MTGIQCVDELAQNMHDPVFKILFSLTIINPLETVANGKILHVFAVSMGMLQMLPLILQNSPFSCIIDIYLNKILLETSNISNSGKSFYLSSIGPKPILLQTA